MLHQKNRSLPTCINFILFCWPLQSPEFLPFRQLSSLQVVGEVAIDLLTRSGSSQEVDAVIDAHLRQALHSWCERIPGISPPTSGRLFSDPASAFSLSTITPT